MQTLETKRLAFIPFSLDLMKATMTDKARLEEMLEVAIPDSWPGPDLAEALPFFVKNMQREPSGRIWNGLIISKTDAVLIGDMGFMGGPDEEGAVEIGYSIVPEYRNQGYATEMASFLIHWALQQAEVKVVTAKCDRDNIGSIKVLTKVGMHRLESEGDMLNWEMRAE
ncbi:MAG: GNAT family N-acetyltransferase [Ktedonobacteraceae bacterium]